jgi:hypothetical protein
MLRIAPRAAHYFLIALLFVACGGSDSEPPAGDDGAVAESPSDAADEAAAEAAVAADEVDDSTGEPTAEAAEPAADDAGPAVEEDDITLRGTIQIKEYSVAFIASGSLGKGTLTIGGATHPFRIGGLGIGGIGVASIDARGNVYNRENLADFPGAYGKARLGITVADKGEGRLWLKNTNGVVLELWTDMSGLALTGGVDGIAITWESDYQSGVDDVKDGSKKAWEGTKKGAGNAVDAVKKPFQ